MSAKAPSPTIRCTPSAEQAWSRYPTCSNSSATSARTASSTTSQPVSQLPQHRSTRQPPSTSTGPCTGTSSSTRNPQDYTVRNARFSGLNSVGLCNTLHELLGLSVEENVMNGYGTRAATNLVACAGMLLLGTTFSCAIAQGTSTAPYLNPALSPQQRAADLVQRMNLEEKASQLVNRSEEIPRLKVPAYNWWSEALDRKS